MIDYSKWDHFECSSDEDVPSEDHLECSSGDDVPSEDETGSEETKICTDCCYGCEEAFGESGEMVGWDRGGEKEEKNGETTLVDQEEAEEDTFHGETLGAGVEEENETAKKPSGQERVAENERLIYM